MDETRIKRLAITLGVSIVIILVFKTMLLKTANQVSSAANRAAAEKRHSAAPGPEAGNSAAPATGPASGVN